MCVFRMATSHRGIDLFYSQFEIAQTAEKAPETQALLVEMSRDRDRARAEAKSSRTHLVRGHTIFRSSEKVPYFTGTGLTSRCAGGI